MRLIVPMVAHSKRRWYQFSLRGLLAAITLLAVVGGGWLIHQRNQARRHQRAAEMLRKVGAEVYATPQWLWTQLAPDSPGLIVGIGLRGRRIHDDDLQALADLKELVWISMEDTPVGNDGLVHLTRLSRLKRLRIDETQVTDAGLAHLADLKELQQLNLYKLPITDRGLVHLAGLTNLRELNLQRTKVTAADVARLQNALPQCQITH